MASADRDHSRSPYRHALDAANAALLQSLTREPESSVSIIRNAKGVAQFEVTVKGAAAEECYATARSIFNKLSERYPYPSDAPSAPESPREPPTPIRRPRGRAAS